MDDDRAPLDKDAAAAYAEMASDLEARYHGRVTRHSSSAFTRIRPGRTKGRSATPHLVETAEDARAFLAARRQ